MEQDYRPSKDLRDAIVVISSTTTSAGAGDGTTLIDTALTQGNNYWKDAVVVILSGNSNGQNRRISAFTAASDTITVEIAFATQIASGTKYVILGQYAPPTGAGDATLANQVLILGDVGDASASSLLSLYGILGNPSASLATTILDGIGGRANNSTLNALLGVTDAAGRSINGNIGDFQAQAQLTTLLAALGIPDVAAKPLYTCLITDRLDSATYGLSALNTDLDTVITDTEKIYDVALGTSPTDGALASFIATGGTALGTRLPPSKSLYDVIALDRLDNATYGLSAIETLVDDLETAIGTIEGATTLHNKLTAARAALLDQITALRLAELDAANLPADVDLIKSDLAGTEVEGTASALNAYSGTATSTETGADVFTISTTTRKKIHFLGVQISGLTSGATATLRMYTKMLDADASLTKFYSEIFTVGTNVPFVPIVNGTIAIRNNVRIEIQSNNAADTSISAKYHYILETME